MVVRPDGWRDVEVARRAYRETWCKREGLEMAVCGQHATSDAPTPAHVAKAREGWCDAYLGTGESCTDRFVAFDISFGEEWHAERRAAIGDLPTLDLSKGDFRLASAFGAMLEGADLSLARLEGAVLRAARLEGGDLRAARLEGADLSLARLEGANLSLALLEGADLSAARLEGAVLRAARLERANLREARLEGADLREADFHDANWAGASNRASPVQFADFRTSRDLTQSQLEHVIGNEQTLLPDRPNGSGRRPHDPMGDAYYVWSCWETPPHDLDAIVARAAGPFADDAERENLRREFLCGPDTPRRRTGTPLALDAPYPDGHPFLYRRD